MTLISRIVKLHRVLVKHLTFKLHDCFCMLHNMHSHSANITPKVGFRIGLAQDMHAAKYNIL